MRKLKFPRPNSMKDPTRVFSCMEQEDHADLKRIAKVEGRPLYEMIRVALKAFIRRWKSENEKEEISPEERYG